jgi:hypothetical protein
MIKKHYFIIFITIISVLVFIGCNSIKSTKKNPAFTVEYDEDFRLHHLVLTDGVTSYPILNLRLREGNVEIPDTLALIEQLFDYYGDERISYSGGRYNFGAQNLINYDTHYFSIQVEALFLITWLGTSYPVSYLNYPCLIGNDGKQESIKGPIVDEAYRAYKEWFEKVKVIGLDSARKLNMNPLDSSFVRWY